jgi:hypothetical protein
MNADDFARLCREEKDSLLSAYFDEGVETAVGVRLREMQLDEARLAILRDILDCVLTDAFYGLLLGLDGAASIGGMQQCFELRDESGNKISGDSELEAAAFTHFHES